MIFAFFLFFSLGAAHPPIDRPPQRLWNQFTLNGTIPAVGWYFDSRPPTKTAIRKHDDPELSIFLEQAHRRIPQWNVYPETDIWMFKALEKYPIQNKRVLIVGSQVPWYEMLSIAYGAKSVVVVDYQEINYIGTLWKDKLQYVMPNQLYSKSNNNKLKLRKKWAPFDAIISISSEEHNGLGRYGDPINPFGDIEHIEALSHFGNRMYLSVPYSNYDCLVFNAHRIYGPIRFPLLIKHSWVKIDFVGDTNRNVPSCEKNISAAHTYQPVHILESKIKKNNNYCPNNPHLQSSLQKYALDHNDKSDKKWIVYTCNCIQSHGCTSHFQQDQFDTGSTKKRPGCSCGGLGDRLNGIISTFLIAMITRRSFAIDWRSPCSLSEHLIPNEINWDTKIWQHGSLQTSVEGCLSLFDFPPSTNTFGGKNVTNIIKDSEVVRFSSNVNMLPSLWQNKYHVNEMISIFGTNEQEVRPLFTKHFACIFSFLFQLSPTLKLLSDQILANDDEVHRISIGVQVRLGGKWDFNLMEVQNDLNVWTIAIEEQINIINDDVGKNSGVTQLFNIFVTSDQSSFVMDYIYNYFSDRAPQIRVIEVGQEGEDDVHLDHINSAVPANKKNKKKQNAFIITHGSSILPNVVSASPTKTCSASIGKMFLDWWVLGNCDHVLISMSGFGASSVWRTRHNKSWVVHDWKEASNKKRYWYDIDYQDRQALGDSGRRVIEQQ